MLGAVNGERDAPERSPIMGALSGIAKDGGLERRGDDDSFECIVRGVQEGKSRAFERVMAFLKPARIEMLT